MKRKKFFGIALATVFSLLVFVPAALADVHYDIGGVSNTLASNSGNTESGTGWELSETPPSVYTLTLNSNYTSSHMGDRVYLRSDSTDILYVVINGDVSIDIDDPGYSALVINGFGDVHINGSSSASSLTLTNNSFSALGIEGSTQTYIGDTTGFSLTANAKQPTNNSAEGIFVAGDLWIGNPPAGNMVVSASAEGNQWDAYGIHCTGSLVINGGAQVTASGSLVVGIAAGIYSEGDISINGAAVSATGDSKNHSSAGIIAANTGNLPSAILIQSGSDVTAEGKGPYGSGLLAFSGKVGIDAVSTVKATAHGDGYSIGADIISGGSSLVTLTADDSDHYFAPGTDITGLDPNVTYVDNSSVNPPVNPGGGGSSGGCDAGFAPSGIAALVPVFLMKKSRKPR